MSIFKRKTKAKVKEESEILNQQETKIEPVKQEKQEIKIDTSILIRPIITEKATNQQANNCYTFVIGQKANKINVKRAIKDLYRVEPIKINIVNVKGKSVRYGKTRGRTKNWKKALVFLKKGEKIEFVRSK